MADRKRPDATLPKEVLPRAYWSFSGAPFAERAAFDEKVRQYQMTIGGQDTWQPEQIVIPYPRIRVFYMCWHGDEQVEPVIELVSDNGEFFTAGELLFKVHNAVVEQLREINHHFFEGLSLHSRQTAGMPPLYVLRQGS
jgi:hypothetical protein